MTSLLPRLLLSLVAASVLLLSGCGDSDSSERRDSARWLNDLKALEPEKRIVAATRLGQAREKKAVRRLIKNVTDVHLGVRKASAVALGQIGDPRAVAGLEAIVADTAADPELRRLAAISLGEIGSPDAVDTLARTLESDDPRLANAGVFALAEIGPQAHEVLLEAAQEGSPAVRRAAAPLLGHIPGARSRGVLESLLQSDDPLLRLSAAEGLAEQGAADMAPELVDMLLDADAAVRAGMPHVLETLGQPAAGALAEVLALRERRVERKDAEGNRVEVPVEPAQEAALKLLSNWRGLQTVHPLVCALGLDNGHRVKAAARLLREQLGEEAIRQKVMRLSVEADPRQRQVLMDLILDLLKQNAAEEDLPDESVARQVYEDMLQQRDRLAQAMEQASGEYAFQSALALCLLGDARGKPPVMAELQRTAQRLKQKIGPSFARHQQRQKDRKKKRSFQDKSLRPLAYQIRDCLQALAPLADRAVADQAAALVSLPHLGKERTLAQVVGSAALSIIARMPDQKYADAVVAAVSWPNRHRAHGGLFAAVRALGDMRAFAPIAESMEGIPIDQYFRNYRTDAYRTLLTLDRKRGYEVTGPILVDTPAYRASSMEAHARVFAEFPHPDAVPPLVHWIDHDLQGTRKVIREALAAQGRANVAWLIGGFEVEDHSKRSSLAGFIAEEFGKDAVPHLAEAMGDESPRLRQGAAWALGVIGGDEAVAAIRKALDDTHAAVRAAAVWSAGALGDDSLRAPVLELIKDPKTIVRAMAAKQLGNVGDEAAVDPLIAALDDPEAEVRGFAALSLGKLEAARAEEALKQLLEREQNPDVKSGVEYALQKLRKGKQ